MTLTPDQAAALSAELLTAAGAWYVDPDSPAVKVAVTAVRGLAFLAPAAAPVVGALTTAADMLAARSVVLPGPQPLCIVGTEDRSDPVRFACEAACLATHAAQMRGVSPGQVLADYLDDEDRALYTAHAEIARAFVRYLLTGEAITADAVTAAAKEHALLALTDADVAMVRVIARSQLASVADGCEPNVAAAIKALAWLRANAPDAIVPEGWRS